ncbi:MAG TPA: dephospho-CoA kinase [Abditibacterium sp.]|jgi:dephospho-CoA kinase
MKILGLTGDIACGKSTVARLLSEKGAALLDSDLLVREIYANSTFAKQVQSLFDVAVIDENGGIDRAKLGEVVFQNAPKLRELENLVFPAVAALRERKLGDLRAAGAAFIVIEAVKLLESGQGTICDAIWCVVCAPEVQMSRLTQNRGLSEAQARARLHNQPSRAAKLVLAAETPLVWIENNGTTNELAALVAREWTRFSA